MVYKAEKTNEISFPLGGIGTGCIGLSGSGRLIDWEIFNKPNKGSFNGMSHFAIKAETDDTVIDARVMNGDLGGSYTGIYGNEMYNGYGFGSDRSLLTGVPHFRSAEFNGEFPIATINFTDEKFPGDVMLCAFNPFIPVNDKDSTIPAAFFECIVSNNTDKKLKYTVCLSVGNPLPKGDNIYKKTDSIHSITLQGEKSDDMSDITVATDADIVSYQEYWYRGGWFDNLGVFWRDFTKPGAFVNRNYSSDYNGKRLTPDVCTIAAHFELDPGETKKTKYVISWHFPTAHNYWTEGKQLPTWKNYYATLFNNSSDSANYSLNNWERLYNETKLFKDALFSSTLPASVLDAISANISILKSPTCLRLENGEFYGWEGCHCHAGSCEGSCTHVWNYAYALPFLFPSLERSMRDLDYKYNMREDGGMEFRLQLPLGSGLMGFRPCADGQLGNIVKTYRDWKVCGDTNWLRSHWSNVKKAISFAWSEDNIDRWDYDKDGVMEGRQHHTLDMELFGPNAWLNGMYLAALKAGAEMAEALGDTDAAKEYTEIFQKGKDYTNTELFNGSYYIQKIDLKDRSILEKYSNGKALTGLDTLEAYWNSEAGEIKYQLGEGSAIDQLLGQWHANLCGLGEIFDKTKTALKNIYKYNYRSSLRDIFNPCRIFALNDEGGTLICHWPDGVYKPVTPAPYSEEAWPGLEYAIAGLMIQEGFVDEGIELVSTVRARFDGYKRNPWNEFECGSNYARSMSSYALLHSLSGFNFDMPNRCVGFNPAIEGDCEFFFSLDSGWGKLYKNSSGASVKLLYGSLTLKKIDLPFLPDSPIKCYVNDEETGFIRDNLKIIFNNEIIISAGQSLDIIFG